MVGLARQSRRWSDLGPILSGGDDQRRRAELELERRRPSKQALTQPLNLSALGGRRQSTAVLFSDLLRPVVCRFNAFRHYVY